MVRSGVELLAKASELSFALKSIQLGLRHDWLRVPVLESRHDGIILLVRVYGAGIRVIIVLNWGVGIESSLCSIVRKGGTGLRSMWMTYFADELGSSFDMQLAACHMVGIVLQRPAWLP